MSRGLQIAVMCATVPFMLLAASLFSRVFESPFISGPVRDRLVTRLTGRAATTAAAESGSVLAGSRDVNRVGAVVVTKARRPTGVPSELAWVVDTPPVNARGRWTGTTREDACHDHPACTTADPRPCGALDGLGVGTTRRTEVADHPSICSGERIGDCHVHVDVHPTRVLRPPLAPPSVFDRLD